MTYFYYILAGLIGGIVAGMGMGGGTLLIPLLTLWLKIPQLMAQAINLIAFVPTAVVSTIILAKNKMIDWKKLLYVLPGSIIATIATSFFVGQIEGDILRKTFGAFMLTIGIVYFLNTIRKCIISYFANKKNKKEKCNRLKW